MAYNSFTSFVRRNAASTSFATVVLAAAVAFVIKGGTASTNYVECKKEFVVASATGGLAKYPFIQWQEPTDDSGSGSEIHKIYWTIGRSPVAVGTDFTVGKSATASGAFAVQNFTNKATASGLTVLYSTGTTFVTSGNYLRGVTLSNPGSGHTSTVMIEYCTRISK